MPLGFPTNPIAKRRIYQYIVSGVAMICLYPLIRDTEWKSSASFQTISHAIGTFLAILVCGLALLRYRLQREPRFQLLSAAFMGIALLDAYQAILSSFWAKDALSVELAALSSWSWTISRLFISLMFLMAGIYFSRIKKLGSAGVYQDSHLLISCSALSLFSALLVTFVPMPASFYLEQYVSRPAELLSTFVFAIALFKYLHQKP